MSWKLLKENRERYVQHKEALKEIAEIVASHPKWIEQEPRLKQLLEVAGIIDPLTSSDLDEALKATEESEETIELGDVSIPISQLDI